MTALSEEQFRGIVYCAFLQDRSVAGATANIHAAFKEDVLSRWTNNRFFKRFQSGDILFENQPRSEHSSDLNDDDLREALKCNQDASTRELPIKLACCQTTIVRHLETLGYRKVVSTLIPHELHSCQLTARKSNCKMEIVKSDESTPVVKEIVQESSQSLEEKQITERLRLLKIIVDEKAEESSEKEKYPPSLVFRGENHVIYETMKHLNISKSFVVSPLSINLGWFPFYNKTNPETRKKLRKHVLEKDTNQRVMENYFHELFGLTWSSDVEATNKGKNFTGKTPKLNFKISSYFSPQNRDNRTISSRFHTSKTATRAQEFITWETNEHYYHSTFHLRIVKLRMEGNVLLTVFLPKEYYELKDFMKEFKSKSIHIPFFSTQPKSVQITLPTFSTKFTTEIKHIMGEFELKEESFVHEAEFQLNQSGVNVPHVPFEGPPVEHINLLRYDEAAIEFHAIRPFLFMLTKSNHIMYMGWYQ